jgi:hypothetical protein
MNRLHGLGVEDFLDNRLDHLRIERLAREHIQLHIIRLFHKMCCNVRSLNQLDECVSRLIPRTKMLDLWASLRNHINVLDQLLGKLRNRIGTTNRLRSTAACIQNKMLTPGHFFF